MQKATIETIDFTPDKIEEAVKMIGDAVRQGLQVSGGLVYKDEIYAVTVFRHAEVQQEGAVA